MPACRRQAPPMTAVRPSTATEALPLVDLPAIEAAAERLRGVVLHTPLVAFGPPEARAFLKAESLQPIGAFKLRGAYATIASLPAADLARGVITYSSGNHAQGVARAAPPRCAGGRRDAIRCAGHQASPRRRRRRRDRDGRDCERRASNGRRAARRRTRSRD